MDQCPRMLVKGRTPFEPNNHLALLGQNRYIDGGGIAARLVRVSAAWVTVACSAPAR
jgi:hypothetical protein